MSFLLPGFVHHVSPVIEIDSPSIMVLSNLLTLEEASMLITASVDKLKPNRVVDDQTGESVLHPERSSEGCHFQRGETDLVKLIETRIETITRIPVDHGEGLQILHYGKKGEYKPHFDFFDPAVKGCQKTLDQHGQRQVTVIMFLNDVIHGGETIFPELNLKIKPKTGGAVIFKNTKPDGSLDRKTLHGGAPVLSGDKWIATKWIRTKPYK